MRKLLFPALVLLLLFQPTADSLRIEVTIGDVLSFTLDDVPRNSTVVWYTEDGKSHTGKSLERPRDLTGLRRVTAVVSHGGGMNTTTFRYYTTYPSYRVYPVDERSFSALALLNLSQNVANMVQVEGRGTVITKTVSLSGVEVRVSPPTTFNRALLFFQLKGGLREVDDILVAWNGTPLQKEDVGVVLSRSGGGACYSFRPEENYLIVSLNTTDPGVLKIDWGGYNPHRSIPGDGESGEELNGFVLLIFIILAAAGGVAIARLIRPKRK